MSTTLKELYDDLVAIEKCMPMVASRLRDRDPVAAAKTPSIALFIASKIAEARNAYLAQTWNEMHVGETLYVDGYQFPKEEHVLDSLEYAKYPTGSRSPSRRIFGLYD